ncbi:hypothetical protein KAU08_12610 [bacterium]|nr:hypothetical protein [bacterium]
MLKILKIFTVGALILVLLVLSSIPVLVSCSGGGGKGIPSPGKSFSADLDSASPNRPAASVAESNVTIDSYQTREPSGQDPFGLIPTGWIDDCPLHPKSYVAHSGRLGYVGFYLVTLVSPDEATIPGVQSYHLETLTDWGSIQVNEDLEETDSAPGKLTITAYKPECELVIISEIAAPDFISNLEHNLYWLERVGPTPLVIRIFYTPLN